MRNVERTGRRRTSRTSLFGVLMLGLLAVAGTAFAQAAGQERPAIKYPPYPDVWGRELPLLEGSIGRLTIGDPRIDKNGRVLIGYHDREGVGARRSIDRLYDFFSGKIIGEWVAGGPSTLPGYEDEFAFFEKHGFKSLDDIVASVTTRPLLPDGSWLAHSHISGPQYFKYGLMKTDSAGRRLFNWMIVHVSDTPRHVLGPTASDFFTNDKDDFVHTVGLFARVYTLPDGTFLLTGDRHPLILRYRGNLESPYIASSRKILLLDPKQGERLFDQSYDEATERLRSMFKRHPKMRWLWPEFTDIALTAKIKLLIDQRRKRK